MRLLAMLATTVALQVDRVWRVYWVAEPVETVAADYASLQVSGLLGAERGRLDAHDLLPVDGWHLLLLPA